MVSVALDYLYKVSEDKNWPPEADNSKKSIEPQVQDTRSLALNDSSYLADEQQTFHEGEIQKPRPKPSYCSINRCDLWCRDSGSPATSEKIVEQAKKGNREAAIHLSWCKECQKVAKQLALKNDNLTQKAYAFHRAGQQDQDCTKHPDRSHNQNVDLAVLEKDPEAMKIAESCLGCQIRMWQINDG